MKKILIILITATILMSCTDSLNEVNPNQITTTTFWKTENDVLSSFAATYGLLRDVNGGYWGVRGTELTNSRGDDFFIRHDMADVYGVSTFTNTPDAGFVNSFWNVSYMDIFRANQILENVGKVPGLTDQSKAAYIAEAKFLRGVNYFNLVINFGDVPLELKVPQSEADYFVAKSPEADVWKQLEEDFTDAAADLPLSYPSQWIGRATKGAALAYLGKAQLYTKDYVNCVSTLTQLTKSPYTYSLMPNFQDNFLATTKNNQESVFEIQLADVGGTGPWAGENAGEALGVTTGVEFAPPEVSGWNEAYPSEKIFTEFQKEKTVSGDLDPRMYTSLIWNYPGATFYNIPFINYASPFGYSSMIKKYQNYMLKDELTGTNGAFGTSSNNERAMRYDDVLLMLAEALTMQGKVSEAYPYVQQIRNRAALTILPAGYAQSQMMAEIQHQDMIEFFREGHRWYDLKRWGLLKQEITNSDKVGKQFYSSPKYDLFPIPLQEIDANPKMIQNSNW